MKKIFLLIIIMSINAFGQFDSLVFTKAMRLPGYNQNMDGTTFIFPLGDQNNDSFDDIMLLDCGDDRGYIYFGGSPIDTMAINSIRFFDSANNILGSITVIDINDDSVKDIVVTTTVYNDSLFWHPGPIKIYYGGNLIDTIPNLTFNPPQSASSAWPQVLKDFNGDGRNELVIYDVMTTSTTEQFGRFYFYNTESQFDTIPHYIMMGDSVNHIRLGNITSSGDINGDGKTDFTISGWIGENPPYNFFRSFYLGNENFYLEPAVTYYQSEHSFDVQNMLIINDINGDGKDDILIDDYGFYPYYYRNAIIHGSFPVDTIPDVGLNAQNLPISFYLTYSLGDVNGDGFNDFFGKDGGFYSNVKLWVGGREMPYTSDDQANKTWFGTSGGFGRAISGVGDVDGDSVNDVAICEIPYGAPVYCNMSRIYIFRGDTSVIGDTGTVTVNEIDIMPDRYCLYDPYPNPFNPTINVEFRIADFGMVKMKIYDVLGREIATIVDEEKPAGKYEINFDASKYSLSSGVYFLKLEAYRNNSLEFSASKKVTLVK